MRDALPAILLPQAGANALERIRVQAQRTASSSQTDDDARLREAARGFEAVFLSYMLKVMRESINGSALSEGGLGQGIYTELFDEELAQSLAGRGALGISDMLIRKLSEKNRAIAPETEVGNPSQVPSLSVRDGRELMDERTPDFHLPLQSHISSHFGFRKDPFTNAPRFHNGMDIAAPEGMEVKTACAGRVVSAGYEKGYGNTVVIEHPGGYETRYAHLGELRVSVGDVLQREEVLGTVGNTGRSTGPHLHFEVSHLGDRIDPEEVLAGEAPLPHGLKP